MGILKGFLIMLGGMMSLTKMAGWSLVPFEFVECKEIQNLKLKVRLGVKATSLRF